MFCDAKNLGIYGENANCIIWSQTILFRFSVFANRIWLEYWVLWQADKTFLYIGIFIGKLFLSLHPKYCFISWALTSPISLADNWLWLGFLAELGFFLHKSFWYWGPQLATDFGYFKPIYAKYNSFLQTIPPSLKTDCRKKRKTV